MRSNKSIDMSDGINDCVSIADKAIMMSSNLKMSVEDSLISLRTCACHLSTLSPYVDE